MRRAAPTVVFALLAALVTSTPAQDEAPPDVPVDAPIDLPPEMPTAIDEDMVLSGRLRLSGDVVVASGVTLTLAPGTHIDVAAADATKGGVDTERCEIAIHGRLVVAGEPERPVSIVGGALDSWFGIVLHGDRSQAPDSSLTHMRLRGAWTGVQVARGRPRFESCIFDLCQTGVATATAYADHERVIERSRAPEPEIDRCLFMRCEVGVFTDLKASPGVSRTTFLDCRVALGNSRPGITSPVSGIGARVSRALFVRNQCAVLGSAAVQDSIFLANDVALRVTKFHGAYSQSTDRIGWRSNVFHDNARIARGESDLGSGHVFVDPLLVEWPAPVTLESAVTPPPGCELQPDSPVRGMATDGGDPGPAGATPPGRRRRAWRTQGKLVTQAYALGPFDALTSFGAARPPRLSARRTPIQRGKLRWASIDTGGRGGFYPDAFGWPAEAPVVMTFIADIGKTGGTLEINGDGRVTAWIDDVELNVPPLRARWGSRGMQVPLPAGKGKREIALVWTDRDAGGVLGVAVHGATDVHVGFDPLPSRDGGELRVTPIAYPDGSMAFRLGGLPHWLDVYTPGCVRLIAPERRVHELADRAPTIDRRGLVRFTLPPGVFGDASTLEFASLRDAHGRRYRGLPRRVPLSEAR